MRTHLPSTQRRSRLTAWLAKSLIAGMAIWVCGCSPRTIGLADEYAALAKRWSIALRAQQMIPTYPLTQDMQPGDILLMHSSFVLAVEMEFAGSDFLSIPEN